MKLFQTSHLFAYAWPHVTSANWRKYPNDFSEHVISVDVLAREIDPSTGVLRTERLLSVRQSVPAWLCRLIGVSEVAWFREISVLDPARRHYCARSYNLSYQQVFQLTEECTMRQDPQRPADRTLFEQRAQITTAPLVSRLASYIEDTAVARFQANAHRGRQGLEQVLDVIRRETEATLETAKRLGEEVILEASDLGASLRCEFGQVMRDAHQAVDEASDLFLRPSDSASSADSSRSGESGR